MWGLLFEKLGLIKKNLYLYWFASSCVLPFVDFDMIENRLRWLTKMCSVKRGFTYQYMPVGESWHYKRWQQFLGLSGYNIFRTA